ncbi:hypothetical protein [Solibacillus isronensis]|uniref:hypothetical protein n=1 Tax=Solibacillus isronensis TaxID=412383 RepID=UPI0007FB449D|nr:hypothetical protein [Solibacillus silvestris]OBW54648.1 hypothetical protein A9986_13535 [Solibacillus silvestris]
MAVKLPVNFTEEQKTVLAVLSIRQLLLIFPVNVAWLLFSISVPFPFISSGAELLIKITVGVILAGVSVALAFIRMEKYDCYLSEFVVRKFYFIKSKKIYTN